MRVLAGILTYNRLELLKRCIKNVEHQTHLPDSILIIDNGSNDGTIEYLKNQPYDWTQSIVDNYDTIINFK